MHSKLKCANVSLQLYDADCGLLQLQLQHALSKLLVFLDVTKI